jgi:hypothetical protein
MTSFVTTIHYLAAASREDRHHLPSSHVEQEDQGSLRAKISPEIRPFYLVSNFFRWRFSNGNIDNFDIDIILAQEKAIVRRAQFRCDYPAPKLDLNLTIFHDPQPFFTAHNHVDLIKSLGSRPFPVSKASEI